MDIMIEMMIVLIMMLLFFGGCMFIAVLWKAFKALGIWIEKNDRGLK